MSTAPSSAIAAQKQSNLAFSFLILGKRERMGMSVFYDFCRTVDDIADDPDVAASVKVASLDAWRADLTAIGENREPAQPLARALAAVVKEFAVNVADLHAIVQGVSLDIEPRSYANFEELRQYCYGVASAVGLVSIRIFGCKHAQCPEFAENLGYALQLTNILRDVVEDKRVYGRVYLPRDEMAAFGVEPAQLDEPDAHPACARLFRLQYFRAKHFFKKAARLLPESDRPQLKAALIMAAFYEDILEKIAARGFQLGAQRVRLGKLRKFQLVARTQFGGKRRLPSWPNPLAWRFSVPVSQV